MIGICWSEPTSPMVERRPLAMMDIIDEVCKQRHIPRVIILGARRTKVVAHARHEAMWRCVNETGASIEAIARIFHRDRTTVRDGVIRHGERLAACVPRGTQINDLAREGANGAHQDS